MKVSNGEDACSRNAVVVNRPKGVAEVDAGSRTEEAEAAVCQTVAEVGVLRMAEGAGAHDLNGMMRKT